MADYEIWFGEEYTGFHVDYSGDILIDSLLEQVEHLRKYYDGKLWLKLVKED